MNINGVTLTSCTDEDLRTQFDALVGFDAETFKQARAIELELERRSGASTPAQESLRQLLAEMDDALRALVVSCETRDTSGADALRLWQFAMGWNGDLDKRVTAALAASPSPPVTQEPEIAPERAMAIQTGQPIAGEQPGFDCAKCGHRHQGQRFGFICIGCPCGLTASLAPPETCAWREEPTCPRCGEDVTDSPEGDLPTRGMVSVECQNCGEAITVEARRIVEYRLTPLSLSSGGTPKGESK
jgi:hypothetical protein